MSMQEQPPLVDELELDTEEVGESALSAIGELPAEVYYGGAAGMALLALVSLLSGKRLPGVIFGLLALVCGLYGQQRQTEEMDAFDELEAFSSDEDESTAGA